MNIINLVIEKSESGFWAWTTNKGFSPNTYGDSIDEIKSNVIMLIKSDITDTGKESAWYGFDFDHIEWEVSYNLESLFAQFKFIKITDLAIAAGINPSLMRQYASGLHNPSSKQAQKIEDAIHRLAKNMLEVSLV